MQKKSEKKPSSLLLVSNRLPISVTKHPKGLHFRPSVGGLATGLRSLGQSHQCQWIGWPGIAADKVSNQQQGQITETLSQRGCRPVFLSNDDIEDFYLGFCNKTIWPLFHYFPAHTVYEQRYWQAYQRINGAFCDAVMKIASPDDYIWVHDYQLMLLPQLIRQRLPEAKVGFFLLIPFPSFELFRLLPWREEILDGLLGADLVGFHTYDYVRHFVSSVARIRGIERSMGSLAVDDRMVKVDAFPMGIDYQRYCGAVDTTKVKENVSAIRKEVGRRKIIISVDRLDYTKGIVQRLGAFDLFLAENPQYKEKVTLILLAVPSRTGMRDYIELRGQLEQLVGRINGEHGVIGWVPVWYLYRAVPFERLVALYNIADVALLTPLRDGMNLVAKEFIAAKTDGKGVLILSEMAGAASELGEAVIVNANNKSAIIAAIKEALEMPAEEQVERNRLMQDRLRRYNITRWARDFMESLADTKRAQERLSVSRLSNAGRQNLLADYQKAQKRLFLLDYDGTLLGFVGRPDKASPDEKLLALLRDLAKEPRNELVIISGRDRQTLSRWLGELDVSLIAEHGARIKAKDGDWRTIEPLENKWKDTIRPILELYADRTPGSSIEEKDFSLVWHFRRSDPELAYLRSQELKGAVLNLTANLDVGVFEGSKILEVKNISVSKGLAARVWLKKQQWDFILAVGDDYTDEDLFSALPDKAYSIKIGPGVSKARFNLDTVNNFRDLLGEMAERCDM